MAAKQDLLSGPRRRESIGEYKAYCGLVRGLSAAVVVPTVRSRDPSAEPSAQTPHWPANLSGNGEAPINRSLTGRATFVLEMSGRSVHDLLVFVSEHVCIGML